MNFSSFKFYLKFYGVSMAVLFLLRLVFLFCYRNDFIFSFSDALLSLLIGAVIDSSVVCVCIVSCILISFLLKIFFKNQQLIFFLLAVPVLSVVFFTNIVDIFYFSQFGSRLNHFAAEVPSNFPTVVSMIYQEYPVLKVLLVFAILVFVFYRIIGIFFRKHFLLEEKFSFKWLLITLLTFASLSFLYYDGPFWKLTSFCSSGFLNQLSSNGAYTFGESYLQEKVYEKTLTIFPEIPDSSAIAFVKNISVHEDEISLSEKFPTVRKLKVNLLQPQKNIVIILCESFSASHIGVLSGGNLSPQFDSWSKKGILFTHCFSNGPRTHFGLTSVVAGFPAIIGSHLIRRKGVNEFQTLGTLLHDAGYETNFFYGGDAEFDDMKMFMQQGGFENIFDIGTIKNVRYQNAMGVCDEDVFDKAYSEIYDGDSTPKLSVILTLSNHAPHHAPDYFLQQNAVAKKVGDMNSTFYYEDYAIGKFLDECSTQKNFANTIFLILADHGETYEMRDGNFKVYHIPALLLNTSRGTGTFDSVCSQMDFAATLVNECGYTGAYHFIGQNLFSNYFKPFSISRNTATQIAYRYGNHLFITDLQYGMNDFYQLDSLSYPSEKINPSDAEKNEAESFLKKYIEGLSVIYRDGLYQARK